MKCLRCKSRGEEAPDYKLHQKNKHVVAMICPKCNHVRGHIGNSKKG